MVKQILDDEEFITHITGSTKSISNFSESHKSENTSKIFMFVGL